MGIGRIVRQTDRQEIIRRAPRDSQGRSAVPLAMRDPGVCAYCATEPADDFVGVAVARVGAIGFAVLQPVLDVRRLKDRRQRRPPCLVVGFDRCTGIAGETGRAIELARGRLADEFAVGVDAFNRQFRRTFRNVAPDRCQRRPRFVGDEGMVLARAIANGEAIVLRPLPSETQTPGRR